MMNQPDSDNQGSEYYPPLPGTDDPRWRYATVMARDELSTELLSQPHDRHSDALWLVHRGDMVWIMREVRHRQYVAAKVGYHIGWLNIVHVKPKLIAPTEDDIPARKLATGEWLAAVNEPQVPQELLATEAEQFNHTAQTEQRATSRDVSRIIRFLQGITGAFSSNRPPLKPFT